MKTRKPDPVFTQADKNTLKALGWPICDRALKYLQHLEDQIKSLQGFHNSVSEALNSGDGTYKP